MSGVISVNGQLLPPEKATISVLDRGFLFGDNVFEVFVCFHGKILNTYEHLERLRASAENLGFMIPWSNDELVFELAHVAEQVGNHKSYLRLVVTRGEGLGLTPGDDLKPNKIVYGFPAKREDPRLYEEGIALKRMVSAETKRGAAAKTGNYLKSILAIKRAVAEGKQDILWTNSEQEITEASTANIFFMQRDGDNVTFVTPPEQSGILLGITRATIIDLLRRAKIPCVEQVIYADELARFDEAFLCSTVRGMVPIQSIDKQVYYTMRPNSVYRHIERLYLTWVQTEVGFRVDWNSGERTS